MSQTKAQLIDNLVQALNFTGTASTPANGITLSATNTLQFSSASSPRLTLNSDGHVDVIGNLDVGAGLDVTGNITTTSGNLVVDGEGTVEDNFRITDAAGTQRLLMGNQDSAGVNSPRIFSVGNAALTIGVGDSWSGDGGTLTSQFSIGKTGPITSHVNHDFSAGIDVIGNINCNGIIDLEDASSIKLGTDDDFILSYDNSNSQALIAMATGKRLKLKCDQLHINNAADNSNILLADDSGGVSLFFGTIARMATTTDGITVTGGVLVSSTGNASLILDSGTSSQAGNQISFIDFKINGSLKGNIAINEATAGTPLEINSTGSGGATQIYGDGGVRLTASSTGVAITGNTTLDQHLILEGGDSQSHPYIELHSNAANVKKWRILNGQSWNPDALIVYDIDGDNARLTIEANGLGINRGANSITHGLDVGGTAIIRGNTQVLGTITTSIDGNQSTQGGAGLVMTHSANTNLRANHFVVDDFPSGSGTYFIQATESGVSNDRNICMQGYGGKVKIGNQGTAPDEKLDVEGNIKIRGGDLKLNNTRGIDFSDTGDGSGSMSNELLDDYEEGTWTPTAAGSGSLGTASGTYVKIGGFVYFEMQTNTYGGTGSVQINGLPYTVTSGFGGNITITNNELTIPKYFFAHEGQTSLYLRNANNTNMSFNETGVSGKFFHVSGGYFTY